MKIVKIGIIGCGRVANHYQTLYKKKKIKNSKIIAVCDLMIKKARFLAKQFKCNFYKTIEDLLNSEDIDLIIISTPSGLHYQSCIKALKANCHVIVEKPIALLINEANKIEKLAKLKKLICCVAYQNRFNPAIEKAFEAIKKNNLGKIINSSIRIRWCRYQNYYNDSWHGKWSLDGGVISQQAIHHLDTMIKFCGLPKKVSAFSDRRLNKLEAEDTLVGIIKFNNGILGTVEATTAVRPKDYEASITIIGEKGIIEIGGIALNKVTKWEIKGQKKIEKKIKIKYSENVSNPYGYSHFRLFNKVINNILEKKNLSPVPVNEAIKSLKLVHSFYSSIENKKWINYSSKLANSRKLGV